MKKVYSLLIALSVVLGLTAQNPANLDMSFGSNGYVINAIGSDDEKAAGMALQADGKILIVGDARISNKFNLAVTRLNADGTPDATFGTNGSVNILIGTQSFGKSVAVQEDGKIVVGGYVLQGNYKAAVVRFNEDGQLDETFGDAGKLVLEGLSNSESCALQSDGKIIIAGHKNDMFGISRVNADGTIDTSFGTNGYAITQIPNYSMSYIKAVGVQADGKIIGVGMSVGPDGYDFSSARFNTDGSLDTGFANSGFLAVDFGGSYSADFGTALTFQEDGKILIGGHQEYSLIPGVPEYDAVVVRLNTDGSYDSSFGTNGKSVIQINEEASYVSGIALQADGKILITGQFAIYTQSVSDIYVARLNANGSIDTYFGNDGYIVYDPLQTEDEAKSILVQEDGKILVAGWTINESNNQNFMVMRLIGEYAIEEDPDVAITVTNITPFSFDVSFTPNLACSKYHFVALTQEDLEMWLPMMFNNDTIALVKAWGIEKSSSYTHSYTEMNPGTEYLIYTVCVGLDESEVLLSPAPATTLSAGGTGVAEVEIEIKEITENTARVIVTPNAETAEFHAGLMLKAYFDEIGEEEAVNYFKEDGWPMYTTDDWVWPDLDSNTEYKAIGVAKNALGEWGPATIKDFKTLGGNSVDTETISSLTVYPNPGNGIVNINMNGANNAKIQVLDMAGRVIYTDSLNSSNTTVDISHFNNGIYIIRVQNGGQVSTTKYVKQ